MSSSERSLLLQSGGLGTQDVEGGGSGAAGESPHTSAGDGNRLNPSGSDTLGSGRAGGSANAGARRSGARVSTPLFLAGALVVGVALGTLGVIAGSPSHSWSSVAWLHRVLGIQDTPANTLVVGFQCGGDYGWLAVGPGTLIIKRILVPRVLSCAAPYDVVRDIFQAQASSSTWPFGLQVSPFLLELMRRAVSARPWLAVTHLVMAAFPGVKLQLIDMSATDGRSLGLGRVAEVAKSGLPVRVAPPGRVPKKPEVGGHTECTLVCTSTPLQPPPHWLLPPRDVHQYQVLVSDGALSYLLLKPLELSHV